jgi:pilus assembly protein Flp/PilA
MSMPITKLHAFLTDESGITAIEYGLIASGIATAIVVVTINVGSALQLTFTNVQVGLST